MEGGFAHLLLQCVHLAGVLYGGWEGDAHVVQFASGPFIQAHDEFVRVFGPLERLDAHAVGAHCCQRYCAPQRAGVGGCGEGHEGLVEPCRLGLRQLVPPSVMRQDGIGKLIGSHVHVGLVLVSAARRGVQQGQAQGAGIGLVPSVLAVIQYRHTIEPAGSGVVGPLVALHLVAVGVAYAACDGAQRDVVGVLAGAEGEGELHLEHALLRLPVHFIDAVDAVGERCHAYVLHEGTALLAAFHTERLAQRSVLHQRHLGTASQCGRRRTAHVGVAHLPCGPCVFVVVYHLLAHCVEHGTLVLQVVHLPHIALVAHYHAVAAVVHLACGGVCGEGGSEL